VFVARPDQQGTAGVDKEEPVRTRGGKTPLGRPGTPGEVANAALFLISTRPASSPARRCRWTAATAR